MKRFFTSYWSVPVVFIVAPSLVFLVLYLATPKGNVAEYRAVCASNLKQIGLAMAMYSHDYGDRLPPAIFPGETVGWANRLQPYLKSYQIFQCSSELNPRQDNPQLPGFTDYWMNRNAENLDLSEQLDGEISKMILMGDGDGGSLKSTASYAIDQLSASWRNSEESPAKRHLSGANYAFVDGHVKFLRPGNVSKVTTPQNLDIYTFSIR